jgi:hypothetical protein
MRHHHHEKAHAKSHTAKMMRGRFEGSRADKAEDKREARKHHETVTEWEHSKADRKKDKAGRCPHCGKKHKGKCK